LEEGDYLDSVILGIRNITPQEFPNDLPLIFEGLLGLSNLKAQFYYLVLINNDKEAHKFCFRFSDHFLEELLLLAKGEQFVFENQLLPIELSEKIVNQLGGIEISKEISDDPVKTSLFFLQRDLWEYTEIRNRLSNDDSTLNTWLDEIKEAIAVHLDELPLNSKVQNKYKVLAAKVINEELDFNEMLCQKYWEEDIVG
jgi:hypothetical protein